MIVQPVVEPMDRFAALVCRQCGHQTSGMISHYLGTRAAVSKNVKKTDWRGCGGELGRSAADAANIHHCSTNYLTNPELNTFLHLGEYFQHSKYYLPQPHPLAIAAVTRNVPRDP